MIKKLIRGIGVMTACLFLFPFSVLAAEKSVTLSESDGGVQAFVELPSEEEVNPVTSLQMEFQVEITQGDAKQAKAEFHFHEALTSSVKEYRYHPDTGILTIYISGKDNLFSDKMLSEQRLALGELSLSTEDALGVKANISVVDDSYRFVSDQGTDVETESINAPGYVEVAVGNGGVEPTPTPDPEEPTPTPGPGEDPSPTPDPEGEPTPTPGEGGGITPSPSPDGGESSVPSITPGSGNNSGTQSGANNVSGQNVTGSGTQQAAAKTGDEMQPVLYLSVAVVAVLAMIFMGSIQRRKRR